MLFPNRQVAISGTVIFTVLSFVIGLKNAVLTILSQQKGRGNESGLLRYLNAFVVLLTGMSIMLGVACFILVEPLLLLLGYPITYILSGIMGEKGIALGMGVSFVISSIAAFLYYRYGKWQEAEVFGE